MEIKKFGFYFLLFIILLIAFKFYSIIYDFLPSIATACVLAYLFNPVYLYFYKLTGRSSLSAFGVIIMIVGLIMIPVSLVIFAVQNQITFLFDAKTYAELNNLIPKIDDILRETIGIDLPEQLTIDFISRLLAGVQATFTTFGPKLIVSVTWFLLSSFIAIFLVYYLLRKSRFVIETFKDYFPLSYQNSDILLNEMAKDTRTLILGQLLVAIIQGTLGGLGFYFSHVSGAVLWGLVMVLMSFIPVLGASLVWFPAAVYLLLQEDYFSGIGLILWGMLIVGTVDNIVRPKLTGTLGKIHPVTVMLGVFIGMKEWGFIGLVIGPIIITVLLNLIRMFREEYLVEA